MRAVLLLLALSFPGRAGAAEATAILSSDSGHYRQALEGFLEVWGGSVAVVSAGEAAPPGAKAYVVFGSRAAARAWTKDAVVVACLAPSIAAEEGDAVTHVSLLGDPGVLLARVRALIPRLKVLRVLWSSDSSRVDAEALRKAGVERGVVVHLARVSPPSSLPSFLREQADDADALWLMPDPALINTESFSILREYAAARKIPFLAPTEGLAERGAAATIAVSFRDMGRAAAESLRARLDGRAEPEFVRSGTVRVTVNVAAARAAGLDSDFRSADKVLP